MTSINVRGIELSFQDVGSGPVLLFIHGHPFDHTMWRPQVEALRAEFRCLAPDLCGYGESGSRPHQVLLDEMALDLLHLLDDLDIAEALVCGLSMGVQVALDLVRLVPERVWALALAAGSARGETSEGVAWRRALADRLEREETMSSYVDENLPKFFGPHASPQDVGFLREIMLRCPHLGAAAALRGRAVRRDHRGILGTLDVPSVVICGDRDSFTTEAEARELAAGLPDAELVWLTGIGHMPNLEQPDEFASALRRLADRATKRSA